MEIDCIILGGSLHGCGLFRDLSLREVSCVLIEEQDFGKELPTADFPLKGDIMSLSHEAPHLMRLIENKTVLSFPKRLCLENIMEGESRSGRVYTHVQIISTERKEGRWVVQIRIRNKDMSFTSSVLVAPAHVLSQVQEKESTFLLETGEVQSYRASCEKQSQEIAKHMDRDSTSTAPEKPLPGGMHKVTEEEKTSMQQQWQLTEEQVSYLVSLYGGLTAFFLGGIQGRGNSRIHPEYPFLRAQVYHAMRVENASTVRSVMHRMGIDPNTELSEDFVKDFVSTCAQVWKWDDTRKEQEMKDLLTLPSSE